MSLGKETCPTYDLSTKREQKYKIKNGKYSLCWKVVLLSYFIFLCLFPFMFMFFDVLLLSKLYGYFKKSKLSYYIEVSIR